MRIRRPGVTDHVGYRPLQVPARSIPVPTSVSASAQRVLASRWIALPDPPPVTDIAAWRALVTSCDELMLDRLAGIKGGPSSHADSVRMDVAGVSVFDIPRPSSGSDAGICLEIHGGALLMGGGENCRAMGLFAASRIGLRTWAVDYRMPPDHPYPAGLDDCVAVYRAMLDQFGPENIVVSGGSAGGNLAAALILRARDEGLPMPAAAVLQTPEVDLTESGDSFQTNLGVDTVLTRSLMPENRLYAGDHDLRDPYLSPLFADFTLGFPRTLLATGTRDLFLSNTVRMHRALRAAGVAAELHVIEAAPHGFFPGSPEEADLVREIQRFVRAACSN